MMARAQIWWSERSQREQRLLLAMGALLATVILWLGILRPLGIAHDSARQRLDAATIAEAGMKGKVAAYQAARQAPRAATAGAITQIVSQTADSDGFQLARLDPQGEGRVAITISNAKPGAFYAWLGKLDAAGIIVEQATLRPNSDATVAVDAVMRERGQ